MEARIDIDKAVAFADLLFCANMPFSVSYETGDEWIKIDERSSYKECWAIFTFDMPKELDAVHQYRIETFGC